MPAPAHAVSASNRDRDRRIANTRLTRTRPPHHLVPALRQGPTLRKLLGPSAAELWGKLQARAFKSPDRLIVTTLPELTGPRGSERTTSWALRRLTQAKLISKVRSRSGLAIRVLAFDRDEHGIGEFSPHLPHDTLRWMHGRRPRGRPRTPKEPMPTPRAHAPEPAPRTTPIARPRLREEELRIAQSFPFVPPDPLTRIASIPRLPTPPLLRPEDRTSAHREILIELYVSACRVYWPRISVAREVKHMRSRIGMKSLTHAAETFLALRLPPALWVRREFDRAADRKSPMRPEVLYDPARIEHYGPSAIEECSELMRLTYDRSEEFRVFRDGRLDLDQLYQRTLAKIVALPNPTDEAAVRAVVEAVFPRGWEAVYASADAKMREITSTLETRAEAGLFLWGPRRG